MALFRRRPRSGAPDATAALESISRFWSWWHATGADQIAQAIESSTVEAMAPAIAEQVAAIDADLSWELSPGNGLSRHLLVVSPGGNPALRATARRWLLAAPAPDDVWSYADSRQPVADLAAMTLRLEDTEIAPSEVEVAARVTGAGFDATLYHPAFASLAEPQRLQAAFLVLDWVLGENAVETWVHEISTTTVKPLDPIPALGLRTVVDHLQTEYTDDDGNPAWAMLTGTADDGAPVIAMAQVPLRASTAPHFDTCVRVVVPFTDQTPEGLPGPDSLAELRGFEDHLTHRLGSSGRLVVHQTHGGVRLLSYYVDRATPAADQLRAAVSGWRQGRVEVTAQHDPSWELVAHLRG